VIGFSALEGQMQQRIEHEFDAYDNQALDELSDELYRFAIMVGVVGIALVALGVAAIMTGRYHSVIAGPALLGLGLLAMAGGALFMRPRVTLSRITHTRGRDITKLIEALKVLDTAHGVFRGLILAFLAARLAIFLLVRLT
jgi:hypothetical protein